MASASASSSSITASEDSWHDLLKQIKSHEVAIGELGSLSSTRAVFQKNGKIFFQTSIQKATEFEQKQLDVAKAKLQNLSST